MKFRPYSIVRHPGIRETRCLVGSALAALTLLSTSCKQTHPPEGKASKDPQDPVAIQIGKREIRLSELQAEIDFLRGKRNPAAANLEAFLEPSVDRLVALEKARALGLDQDPELRRQWENLLIGRLRETEIESKLREIRVTDEEISDYFQRHQSAYSRPAQLHLALLFLSVPASAGDEARAATRQRMEEARSLASKLPVNTRGFGAHAMTYSEEATSRFKGGDIGWLEAGAAAYRWPDEVVKAGFALKEKGDLSEIIETPEGVYLLKKLDSREPVVRSLDGRLRSTLESAILREKRAAVETGLKDSWRKSSDITLHEDVLGSLKFQPFENSAGDSQTLPAAH